MGYYVSRRNMKILLVVIIVLMVIVMVLQMKLRSSSTSESVTAQQMSLEEKLEVLANCGLKLAEPFTVNDLLKSWSREEYEKPGFDLVLIGLGMTEEQEPFRNRCVNLWHFDMECIEDHGDYKRIAERMAEMTQGALHLEDIQDYVDLEKKEAWLSFIFRPGQRLKIVCKVNDDWVDMSVFEKFVFLLETADPSKVYVYYDLDGQDCIIGCVSKEELEELKKNGVNFTPLIWSVK